MLLTWLVLPRSLYPLSVGIDLPGLRTPTPLPLVHVHCPLSHVRQSSLSCPLVCVCQPSLLLGPWFVCWPSLSRPWFVYAGLSLARPLVLVCWPSLSPSVTPGSCMPVLPLAPGSYMPALPVSGPLAHVHWLSPWFVYAGCDYLLRVVQGETLVLVLASSWGRCSLGKPRGSWVRTPRMEAISG